MTHILTKHSLEVVDNSEVIHGYLDYVKCHWLAGARSGLGYCYYYYYLPLCHCMAGAR